MATLEEVLAALNSATTDAREVLSKIPQIATTNGDIPFTFADGTQITLPGLPKLKTQVDGFVADAETTIKGWWKKVFYVDYANGDDVNDGSRTHPLKTIKAAIDRAPIGGQVLIYYKGNPIIDDFIDITGKSVRLMPLEENKLRFKASLNPTGDAKILFAFRCAGRGGDAFLSFDNSGVYYPDIEIIDDTGEDTLAYGYRGILQISPDWGTSYEGAVVFQSRSISLGDFLLIDAPSSKARLGILDTITITITNTQGALVVWRLGELIINPNNITLQDTNGNTLDFLSKIPVLRDSNGTPRNVIANIIL